MKLSPKEEYKNKAVPVNIEYNGKSYTGQATPISASCKEGVCFELNVTLNGENLGIIQCTDKGWQMDAVKDKGLVTAIGEEIFLWYE